MVLFLVTALSGCGSDSSPVSGTLEVSVKTPILSLVTDSPSNERNPIFSVGNLEFAGIEGTEGTVGLYSDYNCTTLLESKSITGISMEITLTDSLISGEHSFYAKQTDVAGNSSECSNKEAYKLESGFISTWRIGVRGYGNADNTVTLPLKQDNGNGYNFVYNFTVDWGDGSDLQEVTAYDDLDIHHTYRRTGDKTIIIEGIMESWGGQSNQDKDKLIEVQNLGHMSWKNFETAFYECSKLTKFAAGSTDTSNVTTMVVL